jgi:hypothetical protein
LTPNSSQTEGQIWEEGASASIHQKGEREEEGLPLIGMSSKGHLSAHLFSALRQFMLAENHAACSAVSERGVPFYARNIGHFITSV